jgi:four helix bundle protein
MTKNYSHRNLIVWQRAQELAHQMIQLTRRLPQNWANAVIVRQIITAATSIGANIAEGHGRFTPGAHGNHLSIAKGSAAETDSWLDMLRREGYLTSEEETPLHVECIEIMAILKSKILDLERLEREGSRKLREDRESYTLKSFSMSHHSHSYLRTTGKCVRL